MVQNLSKRFVDEQDMRVDALESLIRHMDVHIIGHGLRVSRETLIKDYMFPDFLMFCFCKGTASVSHNGRTAQLSPGSFYMYKPFEVYTGELTCEPPFVFSYVYFNIYPYSARIDFERNAYQAGDEVFARDWYRLAGASLEELCSSVGAELIGGRTMLEQSVKNIITHVLFDRLNYFPQAECSFIGVKQAALIDQTFACAEKHLSEPISIDKTAKELGVSRTTLDRVFREAVQITPERALTRFKIERSLQFMKQGCSVKEVAKILGYSSSFHFSKTFLSVMGKRPSIYIEFMSRHQAHRPAAAGPERQE